MATIPPAARLIELDALRGFAVMGILAMNIMAFSMPEMAYINPVVYGGMGDIDLAAWLGAFVLFDGKMRGLFSLLFGASMMLVITRADAQYQDAMSAGSSARSAAKTHFSRMGWLAIFGFAHFYLIWWGDILYLYAVIGCIAYVMRDMAPGRLMKWAALGYLTGAVLLAIGLGSMLWLQGQAFAPGATADDLAAYYEILDGLGVDAAAIAADIALHQSSYSAILADKIAGKYLTHLSGPLLMGFETLPLMMIGMALMKNGFLTGSADGKVYRKFAVIGIAVGGACYIGLAAILAARDFDMIVALNIQTAWSMIPRLIMTIGYLCALILLIRRCANAPMMARIAATGRMAFTNYLGTSIIMTLVFYGYGLGLYGQMGRASLYLVVLAMWALMLIWSKPYLSHFRYGPLEWLWRSLARGQIQPMAIR